MPAFDEPMRAIAKAAKERDWATIDAVLEDRLRLGNRSVMRGFSDARGDALPRLDQPDPVMLADLPSREGITVTAKHGTPQWRHLAQ